jgi:intracellular sulfur oxidation DsrE/DsrF family protein
MSRRIIPLALAVVLFFPSLVGAQATSSDIIKQQGSGPIASGITFPMPSDLHYRIAWRVNVGPTKPDSVVPGFREAASFLYVSDANNVPRANVHLAVVVWGTATHSLLKNEAYKAAKGADNASIPLLQALNDAGVQVIVCGVALINRKLSPSDLLPFVKVAPTATHALATLHAQGYGILTP